MKRYCFFSCKLGMTCRAIRKICTHGVTYYFKNRWNWVDLLQLMLYWIFIVAGVLSYFKVYERRSRGIGHGVTCTSDVECNLVPTGSISFSLLDPNEENRFSITNINNVRFYCRTPASF